MPILRLLGLNDASDFEPVTQLSVSNTTHPLIQTVLDGRVDFAPYEFGITLNRHKILGKYNILKSNENCSIPTVVWH